ncbi:heme ABC exporter ATP-binding protein CcmA [Phreatobacter sp.]|uniref:heme ABC exporter ATP-binding protein CcmA n=1 Tax=Phreatobacter sp. TaxID=1966341 RepID=UPI0025EFB50F|nr:heme ABC exporter ATP-binding protein CcmA [Phreatobacter sp.]
MRLTAHALTCQRGGRIVFADLGFAVDAGEAVQVTGPNGAGKSSLLRLIAGLVRIEEGQLTLEGGDPEASIGEQCHYCGHQDAFKGSLTVAENLAFWTRYLGGGGRGPEAAMERLGIGHLAALPAGYLSAGQRRRLALARLLTVTRPIWLLDEPTAALDLASQRVLAGIMADHVASGGLILAATHGPLGLPTRELAIGRAA